jgi:hypothetical protein
MLKRVYRMRIPEDYLAFARECSRWAHRTQHAAHRQALLAMAAQWAEAAAQFEHQRFLLEDLNEQVREMRNGFWAAVQMMSPSAPRANLKFQKASRPD